MSKEQQQELTLEESFEKLDEILTALESRDITLEESVKIYQQGMELVKQCNQKIDRVEKKCLVLQEGGEFDEL